MEIDKWKAFKELAGHIQDGSSEIVVLFWDDATGTAHIKVGKKRSYYGSTFDEALNKAVRDET